MPSPAASSRNERASTRVFLGEDIAKAGGVFKATVGLYEQFDRCACATRRSPSRPSWAPP
jgi:pyruvate/2-oxoglutarate/acetoin dehydrogenase E1 component